MEVTVENPAPAAKALRHLADLIESGVYRVLRGGLRINEDVDHAVIESNLVLQKYRSEWYGKVMELVHRQNLGFLHNPGGGQFTNWEKGINIQIPAMDDEEDYRALLKGLQRLGLEPTENEEKKNDSPT